MIKVGFKNIHKKKHLKAFLVNYYLLYLKT